MVLAEIDQEIDQIPPSTEIRVIMPSSGINKQNLPFMAKLILSYFGLQDQSDLFLLEQDGLAILANCCNAAAKWYNDKLYHYKPMLLLLAFTQCQECWQSEGIVYIETIIGQVSFHALYGEDQGLPGPNGRVWSEIPYQEEAELVAKAFIEGWSKDKLIQAIQAKTVE